MQRLLDIRTDEHEAHIAELKGGVAVNDRTNKSMVESTLLLEDLPNVHIPLATIRGNIKKRKEAAALGLTVVEWTG